MPKRRDRDELLNDRLPIDVLPYSNEEFIPNEPTAKQKAIMKVAREGCEEAARHHGLSRRRFLQTGAAYGVCLWAINKVRGGGYALAGCPDGITAPIGQKGAPTDIPLDFPGAQMQNLPGEFIFDLQNHSMDAGGEWRIDNPGIHLFAAGTLGGATCRSNELDPVQCIGSEHYVKEIFLDSSTNLSCLSAVPYEPNGNPLPIDESARISGFVRGLAGTEKVVIHQFVMPNRGSLGSNSPNVEPVFLQEELDLMEDGAERFGGPNGPLRAWKIYTPWGDVPYSSGWWLDEPTGRKLLDHVLYLSRRHDMPAMICAHKGFALPSFDQTKAATRDVGVVASDPAYEDVFFLIYHSGFDGGGSGLPSFPPGGRGTSASSEYPGAAASPSTLRGTDNFITALVENGWSARHFALGKVRTPGLDGDPLSSANEGEHLLGGHANVPNVYAELGSVWASVEDDPLAAARLMTKLIWYVGPERIVWGTDALWGGSPQAQIVTFRNFNMRDEPGVPDEIRALAQKYHVPYGLDSDRFDPSLDTTNAAHYPPGMPEERRRARSIRNGVFGYNAVVPYRIPGAVVAGATNPAHAVPCSELQKVRDEYLLNPMASHRIHGPRTRRELFAALRGDPWHRGARLLQNERGFRKRIG